MSFLKSEIENTLVDNPMGLIKELCNSLDPYFQYYSILRFESIKETLTQINNFSFFTIRGVGGAGKSSFKTIIKNSFESNISVFEFNCNEITELDDIFFSFYKFMLANPIKKDILRNQKSNFKPNSIDEQILNYLKKNSGNIVLIFDNFEKLLNKNAELKAENIQSFFQFLSTLPNIKVLLFSATMLTNALDMPQEQIKTIQLLGLNEEQIKDFLAIFKVEIPQSLLREICEITGGAIFSLKFLANSHKILDLPLSALLKERSQQGKNIDEFLAQKLITKLSPSAKKILFYLSLFRHEIDSNILKSVDKFEDIQNEINILKNYMLIEGNESFELRDFVKKIIFNSLSDRNKMHFYNKIADFYAEQIPLKPNERVIKISRSSMYTEKFYHYNLYSKLEKNFELQSSIAGESQQKSDKKLDAQTIKYIASTKYFPDFEIKKEDKKQENEKETKIKEKKFINIEISNEVELTEEEKKLLQESDIDYEQDYVTQEPQQNTTEENFREDLVEKIEEIKKEEETEIEKAEKLLKKGLKFFEDGQADKSITYFKNAMSLLQDNDKNAYYSAKLSLSKAYIDNFKYEEARENLLEIINTNTQATTQIDAYIELAQIEEYHQNTVNTINYFQKALDIAISINDKNSLSKIYFKLGLAYDDTNETEKALYHYLLSATEAFETQDKTILAPVYANIASIYEEQGDLSKATDYYNKSLKADEATQNYFGQAKNLSALGNIFFNIDKINIAIKLFIQSTQVAKKTQDTYLIASSYLELGDTFLSIQDYKNALKAYFLAKKNIDNTISTDSKNKIERRFDMIVDAIGEKAYRFLVKELKQR